MERTDLIQMLLRAQAEGKSLKEIAKEATETIEEAEALTKRLYNFKSRHGGIAELPPAMRELLLLAYSKRMKCTVKFYEIDLDFTDSE